MDQSIADGSSVHGGSHGTESGLLALERKDRRKCDRGMFVAIDSEAWNVPDSQPALGLQTGIRDLRSCEAFDAWLLPHPASELVCRRRQ